MLILYDTHLSIFMYITRALKFEYVNDPERQMYFHVCI